MEENKNPGINDAFLWGINVTVNDKTYSNKDIIDIENKDKLDKESETLEKVLSNIDIIKSSSENFIQSILDNNPHLKNIKEKKDNNEEAEEAAQNK